MIVLGIETATAVCGVALVDNGNVKAELHIEAPQAHSEKLLTMVDEVLCASKHELKDMDAVACSIGPGSFTGLRIGLSVAKGLAFASAKPLVAVSTLEALAYNAVAVGDISVSTLIVPMIDARRDEVYYAAYTWNGKEISEFFSPDALKISELFPKLHAEQNVVLTGDGAEKFYTSVHQATELSVFKVVPQHLGKCSAVSVARLGEIKYQQGQRDDLVSLEPQYVKEFYTTMNIPSSQTVHI
jgi:tRNA threonylcarbamoyladenosine biosynthesis protein TsaB